VSFFSLFDDEQPSINNSSAVNHSGNSDVDVDVNIDTTALAYAFASFLHATGNLNSSEFENMVQNLNNLIDDPQNASIAPITRPNSKSTSPSAVRANKKSKKKRRRKSNNRVMMATEPIRDNNSLGVIHAYVPAHQYKKF
jgi:hypothetical protein